MTLRTAVKGARFIAQECDVDISIKTSFVFAMLFVEPSPDTPGEIDGREHVFTGRPSQLNKTVLREGYIIIDGCTSRIGIPFATLNLEQATKMTSSIRTFRAPCACGTYTLVANFCLDEIRCQKCKKPIALPGGRLGGSLMCNVSLTG